MKKWRTHSLIWYFQTHHRNSIHLFCESIFICVNHYHLSYLTVKICKTILMTMFFLITIKTFIFCEISFSFIWFDRDVLCTDDVDIHEIMCKNRQIQKCESSRSKISLSIWLLISWSLIETEIFINSLTQNSKLSKSWQHVSIYQLISDFVEYCFLQNNDLHIFISVQFTHQY